MRSQIIAWDSCIILDAIQKTPNRYDSIAPMINAAAVGDLKIVVSAMSYAECYYLKEAARTGLPQPDQNDLIEKWLESAFLIKRANDFGVSKIAGEICRQFRGAIKPPDAVIAATALRHNAEMLITCDDTGGESLLACDGKIAKADGTFLRICKPEGWNSDNSPQLFDGHE